MPNVASRPSGASAARLWSKTAPPVISSTMSTLLPWFASRSAAVRSSARESTTTSAPSSRHRSRFASLDAVAMIRPAPQRLASWIATVPTPPAPAWITTDSPACRCVDVRSRCHAVAPWTRVVSASASLTPSGTANIRRGSTAMRSA